MAGQRSGVFSLVIWLCVPAQGMILTMRSEAVRATTVTVYRLQEATQPVMTEEPTSGYTTQEQADPVGQTLLFYIDRQ